MSDESHQCTLEKLDDQNDDPASTDLLSGLRTEFQSDFALALLRTNFA